MVEDKDSGSHGSTSQTAGQHESDNDSNSEQQNGPEVTEAEVLREQVTALENELSDYKDRMFRIVADSENLKKRVARERQELEKYSLENILRDMLPLLDSFEKALGTIATSDTEKSVYAGVEMVHRQFVDVLAKHGLEAVDSLGQPFDPNLHQAVQRVQVEDVAPGHVVEQYAKGYLLHERLLRPAMVTVAAED